MLAEIWLTANINQTLAHICSASDGSDATISIYQLFLKKYALYI